MSLLTSDPSLSSPKKNNLPKKAFSSLHRAYRTESTLFERLGDHVSAILVVSSLADWAVKKIPPFGDRCFVGF